MFMGDSGDVSSSMLSYGLPWALPSNSLQSPQFPHNFSLGLSRQFSAWNPPTRPRKPTDSLRAWHMRSEACGATELALDRPWQP